MRIEGVEIGYGSEITPNLKPFTISLTMMLKMKHD
jgi:hypothetical protein